MISLYDTVIGDIGFDAVISEGTDVTANVTGHPVEFGAEISDHVYAQPVKISLEGIVSNQVFYTSTEPFGSIYSTNDTRAQNAFQALERILRAGQPFRLETKLKSWPNMVIESLSISQDKSTAEALIFVAMLREVIIVEYENTTLPATKIAAPQDASPAQLGTQTPQTSVALGIVDALSDTLSEWLRGN